MSNSLTASSSGLRVHQHMLDVVGNNLANLNTPGYKSQRIRFSNQFSVLLESASGPSANGGGKNPVEIGLGVQVAGIDTRFEQGTTEATGNKLDLAIQDAGFFLVRNGGEFLATRAGAFSVDAHNYLVDPSTGNRVQRAGTVGEGTSTAPAFQIPGNNDISIRHGMTIPGRGTQNVTFRGNLDARADSPLSTVLTAGQPLKIGGEPATANTLLNDLDQTVSPYVAGDRIVIQGSRVDGSSVEAAYVATGTAADTLGALMSSINTAYLSATPGIGATAGLDADGRIQLTANEPGPSKLTLTLGSDPADDRAVGLNLFIHERPLGKAILICRGCGIEAAELCQPIKSALRTERQSNRLLRSKPTGVGDFKRYVVVSVAAAHSLGEVAKVRLSDVRGGIHDL